MCKRKRRLETEAVKAGNFVEAEAGSKGTTSTSNLAIHIERQSLNVVQFLKNIRQKVNV